MFIQKVYFLKRTVNIVSSNPIHANPCNCRFTRVLLNEYILELKAQYFREKDSFATNQIFYSVQFLNKSVKWFVIFHQPWFSQKKKRFLQLFNNLDKT